MLYMMLVFGHLLATSMALGAIVATDLRMLSKLSHDKVRIPPPNEFVARLVSIALVLLWATGAGMVWLGLRGNPDFLTPKLQGKLVLVLLLTFNAFALHRFTFPRLARGRSLGRWRASDWLVIVPPVALSNCLWMFCAFVGIARPWNQTMQMQDILEIAGALYLVALVGVGLVLAAAARASSGGGSAGLHRRAQANARRRRQPRAGGRRPSRRPSAAARATRCNRRPACAPPQPLSVASATPAANARCDGPWVGGWSASPRAERGSSGHVGSSRIRCARPAVAWPAAPRRSRARHARRAISRSITGSTAGPSTRTTTTSSCGAVAPAAQPRMCVSTTERAAASSESRRAVDERRSAREPQRAAGASTGKAQRRVEEALVGGRDRAALEPAPAECDRLQVASALERLVRRRQAEREHIPADRLGAGCEVEADVALAEAAAVGDGLQRQPLDPGARARASASPTAPPLRPWSGRSASPPRW